jgi:hypothetical protein
MIPTAPLLRSRAPSFLSRSLATHSPYPSPATPFSSRSIFPDEPTHPVVHGQVPGEKVRQASQAIGGFQDWRTHVLVGGMFTPTLAVEMRWARVVLMRGLMGGLLVWLDYTKSKGIVPTPSYVVSSSPLNPR